MPKISENCFPFTVQSLNYVHLFATPWTAALQASRSFTISQSWLRLMSIESMMPSNNLMLCRRSPSPLAWRPDFPGAPREAH